jgi:hypothetical protein
MSVNGRIRRMLKEPMTYFRALSSIHLEGLRKIMKSLLRKACHVLEYQNWNCLNKKLTAQP